MIAARVDAMRRTTLPRQIHEMLGEVVELKHVGKEKIEVLSRAKKTRLAEAMARGRRKKI